MRVVMEMAAGGRRPEWTIIELQGSVLSRTDNALDGSTLGKLSYDGKGKPILRIGHHELKGKVVALGKPFAVLKKRRGPRPDASSMDESDDAATLTTRYDVVALIRQKLLFQTRPKPIINQKRLP